MHLKVDRALEQAFTANKETEKAITFTKVLNRFLKINAAILVPYSAVFFMY